VVHAYPAGRESRRAGDAAREKSTAFRKREVELARRRHLLQAGVAAIAVLAIVVVAVLVAGRHRSSTAPSAGGPSETATVTLTGPPGPEGMVLEQGTPLAAASGSATGQTVDGVQCNSMEQAVYHIHVHLSVYVDGSLCPVPPGIGVVEPVAQHSPNGVFDQASHCYYWLHTHAQDGIIHVEAPNRATYTLGNFFDIWHQPLSTRQVGPARGSVTAYVNGARYTDDATRIPLDSHEDIQLDIGTPAVAPRKIDWSHAQL
jgi:hypothetical protein